MFTKFQCFLPRNILLTAADTKFMFTMKCLRLIVLQFGFLSHFQTMKFYGSTRIPYRHVTVFLLYIISNRYNVDIRYSSTFRITNHLLFHPTFCFVICNNRDLIQGLKFQYFLLIHIQKKFLPVSINAIIFPHAICILLDLKLTKQNGLQSTGYYIQTLVV